MSIYKALLEAQGEFPALQRNAINPHFGSRFISLDSLMGQVLPVLTKHGMVLTQSPTLTETGEPGLRTTLTFVGDENATEESITDVMPLVMQQETPQGQGSAITYARRYSLMALLGLVADQDDDANSAQPTGSAPAARQTTRRRAPASTPVTPDTSAADNGHSENPW